MEGEASCVIRNSHGITAEQEDELGTPSSSSDRESSSNSTRSSSSDFMDDATSPSSSSSSSSSSADRCPLYQMSDLMAKLPIKRGLSKYFQGKSQSFTSLSSAGCLEDLVKPERPYNKKLKTCKSYAAGLDSHKSPPLPMGCSSRTISKRPSKGSLASLVAKRSTGFLGSGGTTTRPPVPPHRSTVSFSGQTLLFA